MIIRPDHKAFQQVHDYNALGVLAIDEKGIIHYTNPTALAYASLQQDILGHNLFDFYNDTIPGSPNKNKLLNLEEIQDQEFIATTDGKEQWVLLSSKVHRDEKDMALIYLFIRDITNLKKKEKLFSYLNKAAEELAKARDTQTALDKISQFIVPTFANWFTIDLLKDDRMELLLLKHEDPDKIKWAHEYRRHYPPNLNSDSGAALVLKTGKPSLVAVITNEMVEASITDPVQREAIKQIGLQSVIMVAISGKDKRYGVVTFISSTPGRYFDETDLDFAQNFASLVGLALENASLNEEASQVAKQLRFLTDAIPHKMWTSGPDGRATYYNQGWYDYTGIHGFENLREQIWDIMHPDDRAIAAVEWPKAIQSGEGMEMEHRFRRHDGQYRWHLTRFSAHKNEEGEVILWVGTSTDIHEQKISGIELAAANEELAAGNEELAAVNEELTVINEEQVATNEELIATQNYLEKTIGKLEEAYEQARLSKQAAQLGTFDMDLVKGTMEWDERCRTLFGINHTDTVTYEKDFVGGLHQDDRERVLQVIENSMTKAVSNGDYDVEYRTIDATDQQLRWVRAKGKVYFDEQDRPERFIGSVLDITDQKLENIRSQENIERQARLAAIVDTSDDTILSKTLQGIITSWNTAAERMFGYTQAEAVGKHISLIIPPSRLNEEDFIIGQIRKGQKVDHFETIRVAKDGHEVAISLTVSPITDINGNIIGASKIARDISIQIAAQEASQRYTERLEVMNTMVEAISEELDLNKILQKVTDATTLLTGAKFGAFFYNTVDDKGESYMLYTLSGAPREAFEKFGMPRNTAIFSPTFAGQGVVRSDDITKDARYGHNRPHHGMPKGHLPVVSYLAVPVISRSGDVIGGLFFGHPEPGKFTREHEGLVASIAAQAAIGIDNAKLYEEIKALNDKKDEFIGLASHELKTPLTSISGYLQILSRLNTDTNNQRFVDKTLDQVKKLTALVNDLLDVSKIESGKLQLTITEFDIKAIVEDAIELIQHSTNKYIITLETDMTGLMVRADSQRIEQILVNLLTNAIKYSPGKDRVEVFLNYTKKTAIIGIKDYGLGIAADKLPHVFSRFYRVDDSAPNISGLGIGLYLSQEIITRHNGKIWAESELGKGSTFWFSLPMNN